MAGAANKNHGTPMSVVLKTRREEIRTGWEMAPTPVLGRFRIRFLSFLSIRCNADINHQDAVLMRIFLNSKL